MQVKSPHYYNSPAVTQSFYPLLIAPTDPNTSQFSFSQQNYDHLNYSYNQNYSPNDEE